MIKRKVKFSEVERHVENSNEPKTRQFKENHSLDSDEEDDKIKENEGTNILDDEEIEGQEDETIRNDGGITVTPFNLKDELEEGHFDAQGNYIPNKKDDNVTDGWLESVDWNKIKEKESSTSINDVGEEMQEDYVELDVSRIKREIAELLRPGETVLKALCRLGGNKRPVNSADRWKKKKAKVQEEEAEVGQTKRNTENLLKLTGLVDSLLQNGDFQIYEKTHEKILFELKGITEEVQKSKFDDAEESDDELEAAFKQSDKDTEDTRTKTTEKEIETKSVPVDEVQWMYKLSENSELLGPFSNSQMIDWQNEGKFENAVYCCKVGNETGNFYNSHRIDFDLYS